MIAVRRRLVPGFTLIEVVVAMAIIVVVLAGLFLQINRTARMSGELRERTLAEWIALNRLVDMRLNGLPPSGQKTDGSIDYATLKWRWQTETIATPVKNIVRIRVRVGLDSAPKDEWIATVDGFSGAALQRGSTGAGVTWGGTPGPAQPGAAPGPLPPPSSGAPTT
jgi:general secretion pathway protein I